MSTQNYKKLLREARGYLRDSNEKEDGHEIQYDEGYIAGLKDAKTALLKDLEAAAGPVICWDNNHTQFARLLAEIYALPLNVKQYHGLMASMDLGYEDIDELFERAMLEWGRAMKDKPVRKETPERELEAFVDGSSV